MGRSTRAIYADYVYQKVEMPAIARVDSRMPSTRRLHKNKGEMEMPTLYTPEYILHHIIRPTLSYCEFPQSSPGSSYEHLVFATGAHESLGYTQIYQMGGGPALSPWQIEPLTARNLWTRHVIGRTSPIGLKLSSLVFLQRSISPSNMVLIPLNPTDNMLHQLATNFPLACAICRLKYYDSPFVLRPADDLTPNDYAQVWKMYYNSLKGKGTVDEFLSNYREFVAPVYRQ
jgi:hypothetical protein